MVMGSHAQDAPSPSVQNQCFSVHVHLDGRLLDGPSSVTLYGKGIQKTIEKSQGCFHVPAELLLQDFLDISFTVEKNALYLPRISTFRLRTLLDVEIEDKKFTNQYLIPKHSPTREACFVAFEEGEPGVVSMFTHCRRALK
jgi:hypothetical protein